MKTLKELLNDIWNSKRVVNPQRRNTWRLHPITGLPATKKSKPNKRAINRMTKEFSWRK